jgi:predicted ATP-dependent protease
MAPSQSSDLGAPPAGEDNVCQYVEQYVQQLKADGAIRSPAVERAFRTSQRRADDAGDLAHVEALQVSRWCAGQR